MQKYEHTKETLNGLPLTFKENVLDFRGIVPVVKEGGYLSNGSAHIIQWNGIHWMSNMYTDTLPWDLLQQNNSSMQVCSKENDAMITGVPIN